MAEYLFEEIAANLIQQVCDGMLSVGDKLPSERIMAEQFGVSRNVIREAIRVLGEKGFVQVQAGRGAFICKPDGEKLTENLSAVVGNSSASPSDIVEAREIFESALAVFACGKVRDSDIEQLRQIYQRMEKAQAKASIFAQLDQEFHLALARCTQNSVLILLAGSIYQLSENNLFSLTPHDAKRIISAQAEHLEMIHALEARDSRRIQDAVHRHIHCIREQLSDISDAAVQMAGCVFPETTVFQGNE